MRATPTSCRTAHAQTRGSYHAWTLALASVFLMMFTLSGCSGCGEDEDKCEGVVCADGGICGAASGQCINPEVCGEVACLPGYSCGIDSVCVADSPCSEDETCERGICQEGACVNRDSCTTQADCVAPNTCDTATGACVNDPCQDGSITCARGVCSSSAGACVNEVVCTQATEQTACLAGNICVNQVCVDEATFCGQLACERGVCSPSARACVSAPNCGGEDARCVAGEYCAPDNTCQPNVCDANMIDCPRGVCDVASGECVNPDTCTGSAQCLDDNVCIGSACVPRPQACGAEGCPGNQLCVIDDASLSASCQEDSMASCTSALDCTGERICAQGACADAPACPAEDTPNNTPETATNFQQASPSGSLTASLCQGDVDFYSFDTRASTPQQGKLRVDLTVASVDLGLGTLIVELRGPQGGVLATASVMNGRAQLEADITVLNQGVYQLVVRGDADVLSPGVRYTLTVGLFEATTLQACAAPRALTAGMNAQGNTLNGASNGLRVACGRDQVAVPEEIWGFTLAERSFVQLSLLPDAQTPPLAFTLRDDCLRSDAQDACAVASPSGELTRSLEPGDYFVVVQAASAAGGGAYTIALTTQPAICTSQNNSCLDATIALECNAQGTAFEQYTCEAGCELATGRCASPPGDRCELPRPLQGGQETITIDWRHLSPAYDPGEGGCVPTGAGVRATAGPDRAVQVSVGPGQALFATLTGTSEDTALYLVDDCDDVAGSCVEAVNNTTGQESMLWYNDSADTRDMSLIADIARVDANTTPSTLTVEVRTALCPPTRQVCGTDSGGNAISRLCNDTGTGFGAPTICPGGCDASTGLCQGPQNNLCGDAIALTSGVSVTGDLNGYTADYPLSGTSSCLGSTSTTQADAHYKITLSAGDVLDVSLTAPGFTPIFWIAETCDMDQLSACLVGFSRSVSSIPQAGRFVAPRDGEYQLVVTSTSSAPADGSFVLSATRTPQQCVPGSAPTCDATNTSLQACDLYGLAQTVPCMGGCNAGACDVPKGDICADAIPMTGASGSLSGTFNTNTNTTVLLPGFTGACYVQQQPSQQHSMLGEDTFYRLDLAAGDAATITLTTGLSGASLVLFEDCALDSCVANNPLRGAATLSYYAEQARSLIVMVDHSFTTSSSAYTVSWEVTSGQACAPGQARCLDANTVGVCDSTGGAETPVSCAYGCALGGCGADVSEQDTCANVANGPTDIGRGVAIVTSFEGFTNDINIPAVSGSCTGGFATAGRDMFFKALVQPDEVLRVEAQLLGGGSDNVRVYALTDCAAPATSCVAGGASAGDPRTGSFDYTNTTGATQTLIIGVDSSSASISAPVRIRLEVTEAQCTPGTIACDAAGQALELCNANSQVETFPCQGACVAGACETPGGDFCADARPLIGPSGSISDSWADGTHTYSIPQGTTGGCYIHLASHSPSTGRDDFYRVDLQAGELLTATLTTTSTSAYLFILEDCVNPDACVTNNPVRGSTTQYYYAQQARTVYLATTTSSSASTAYTLDWQVSQGLQCAPGQARCVDPDTASRCAGDGQSATVTPCASGCAFGACNPDVPAPAFDVCADVAASAQDIGEGISLNVDLTDYTDNIDMASAESCTGAATGGRDIFQKIILQPGEIVEAKVVVANSATPSVYLLTDCANPATSCVKGERSQAVRGEAQLLYANTTGAAQTLIVGADGTSSLAMPMQLFIGKVAPECTPGERQCDIDGSTLLACNAQSVFERVSCAGTCTAGRCDAPQGDLCPDAIPLQGDTGMLTASWAGGTNSYAPDAGLHGACYIHRTSATGTYTTNGRERFYSIDLSPGEQLTATLTGTSTTMLYLLKNCYSAQACLTNNPRRGDATLTYYATQPETIILVADTSSTTNTDFTLGWSVTQGGACAPNTSRCVDANTAARCGNDGLSEETFACANGCVGTGCAVVATDRDVCANVEASAQDVGQGISDYAFFADFTNDISMTSTSSCTFTSTSGRDLFYKVRLQPGEVVRASATELGSLDPVIYALTSCADPEGSCVAGGNSERREGFASLTYANATPDELVLIIGVDLTSAGSVNAQAPVQIAISVSGAQCTPGQTRCDLTGGAVEVCNADGLYDTYACDGACVAGACVNPAGDFCQDAIALQGPSGQVMADWSGGSNTYAPTPGAFGGCYVHLGSHVPEGRDDFYKVDLQAGELLTASLTTNYSTASLFILEGCVERDDCAVNNPLRGSTTLRYYAEQARTVYLAATTTTAPTSTTTYTLDWEITQGLSCVPNQSRCADAMTAAVCDADGQSETLISCAEGCASGACAVNVSAQDICATVEASPQDIGSGISAYAIYADFTNNIDIAAASSCAGGARTAGRDIFYKVVVDPGEVLVASAQGLGNNNPVVYALTSCADPANSCVAGGREIDSTDRAELAYANETGAPQTLIIGVDTSSTSTSNLGPVQISISVGAPTCSPGDVICDASGQNITLCDESGVPRTYPCDGGCSNGACATPRGDACVDAIPLVGASGDVLGRDANDSNTYMLPLGFTGQCYVGLTPNTGLETFYKIDLLAGQELIARMESVNVQAMLFLLEGCVFGADCVKNNSVKGATTLRYRATQDRTLYLVADKAAALDGEYRLRWSVTQGNSCVPGESRCVDANTVAICDVDGQAEAQQSCAAGCEYGGCRPVLATQDSCAATLASAQDVGSGIAALADFGDLTNNLDLSAASSCAEGRATPGPDLFYKVTLAAGDVLNAKVQAYNPISNNGPEPLVYILSDCSGSAASCLAGGAMVIERSGRAQASYVNSSGATQVMLVGVDATAANASGPVSVLIDRRQPECTPGISACAANGAELLPCSPEGVYEAPVLCRGGCAAGACVTPYGDYCADAIPVNPGGAGMPLTYQDNDVIFRDLTSTHTLSHTNLCLGAAQRASGNERFYAVSLAAGQLLSATMVPSSSPLTADAALYVLADCADSTSCIAPNTGSEAGGLGVTETVQYLNTTGAERTVYLVADTQEFSSGGYSLTITLD